MVVFGDSNSDVGRRFNAPASFQFEEYGIGPFPWKRLFDGLDSDVRYIRGFIVYDIAHLFALLRASQNAQTCCYVLFFC